MIKTSIIIPVWNQHQLTKNCIDSIYKYTRDFEIIIVDNGSEPAIAGHQKIIRNEKNLGFPVAVNQGIKAATGEIIVILNNDTLVTPDWLEHLQAHLKNYDMIGPVTNRISGPQMVNDYAYGEKYDYIEAGAQYYKDNKGENYPFHRLVFFCVAIKRAVFDKIGYLDERFGPGNFEDDDFCLRAIEAGFKLGIAKDVFIYHFGNVSHKSLKIDYNELLGVNRAKFNAKWPQAKYEELQEKAVSLFLPKNKAEKYDLTLCIIAKNEAMGLEKCIKSARPYVKSVIVVVDDSSTDKTLEIAGQFADVVKMYRWADDFSKARNLAHTGVDTGWVMFLDGHEYIQSWPDNFRLPENNLDGLVVPIQMENGVIFHGLRIYKTGCIFEGATHELANCKKAGKAEGMLIRHNRLGGQSAQAAADRNAQRDDQIPRIMGEQLRRSPSNIRASFHLANHAQAKGLFGEALNFQSKYLKYSKNKDERWFVYFNRSLCHMALGHLFRAFWAACMADLEMPGRWEIAKLKGLIFYQKGWYNKALENLIESFSVNHGHQTYRPWGRDEGGTWNIIGESFYRLGLYDKAHIAFLEASKRVSIAPLQTIMRKRAELMEEMAKKI